MKFLKYTLVTVLLGVSAFAAKEILFDTVNSPKPQLFVNGLYIGNAVTNPVSDTTNKLTKHLSATATIDFVSSTAKAESSGITLTGVKANDPCYVGVPTAAGALKAQYTCYVSAADTVKVVFEPVDQTSTTCTLGGQSPATCTATVSAGSTCNCSLVGTTAASAAKGCAVSLSSTTLTVTSANAATEVSNITCIAPVDPASGTFQVMVDSSQ